VAVDASGCQSTPAVATGYPMWISDLGFRHADLHTLYSVFGVRYFPGQALGVPRFHNNYARAYIPDCSDRRSFFIPALPFLFLSTGLTLQPVEEREAIAVCSSWRIKTRSVAIRSMRPNSPSPKRPRRLRSLLLRRNRRNPA
jgi:hypothetical protein